ncbi:hypothetical protein BGW80DRAFT_694753 [Lactifluus volemus]|nr:hypothetical protein BGW80DRAFT_694753 [Lactifluus volemus]
MAPRLLSPRRGGFMVPLLLTLRCVMIEVADSMVTVQLTQSTPGSLMLYPMTRMELKWTACQRDLVFCYRMTVQSPQAPTPCRIRLP